MDTSMAPSFLGTLPGWITAASCTTMLGILLRYRLGLRKLQLGDEADIRDHYAQEVRELRSKLNLQEGAFQNLERHWRELLDASDKRHEECEQARRELRKELEGLHDELRGVRDQIRRYSAGVVTLLPPDQIARAPLAAESADRVKRIVDENGGK